MWSEESPACLSVAGTSQPLRRAWPQRKRQRRELSLRQKQGARALVGWAVLVKLGVLYIRAYTSFSRVKTGGLGRWEQIVFFS